MNETEHLLIVLGEECAEVQQRISKALRFGLSEIEPEQRLTNAERIQEEFTDLIAAWRMLVDRGVVSRDIEPRKVMAKMDKVEHFMKYARQQGTLDEPAAVEAAMDRRP